MTIQDGKSLEIRKDISGKRKIVLTEETKKYVHVEHYEDGTIILMRDDAAIDVKWNGTWLKGRCGIDYKDFAAFFGGEDLWGLLAEKEIANETKIYELNDYLKMVVKNQDSNTDVSKKHQVGAEIWKNIK